ALDPLRRCAGGDAPVAGGDDGDQLDRLPCGPEGRGDLFGLGQGEPGPPGAHPEHGATAPAVRPGRTARPAPGRTARPPPAPPGPSPGRPVRAGAWPRWPRPSPGPWPAPPATGPACGPGPGPPRPRPHRRRVPGAP